MLLLLCGGIMQCFQCISESQQHCSKGQKTLCENYTCNCHIRSIFFFFFLFGYCTVPPAFAYWLWFSWQYKKCFVFFLQSSGSGILPAFFFPTPTDFSSFSVASWKKDIACHLVAETDTPHDYVRVCPSCEQKTFQATQRDVETSISIVISCSIMLCNRSFQPSKWMSLCLCQYENTVTTDENNKVIL